MFHRTHRLFLRPAWPEDWAAVLGGIADEGVVRNLARAPWPYGPNEARAFAEKPQDPLRPHFLIVDPAGKRSCSRAVFRTGPLTRNGSVGSRP